MSPRRRPQGASGSCARSTPARTRPDQGHRRGDEHPRHLQGGLPRRVGLRHKGGFVSSCEWVVALPLGRRGRHRRGNDAGVYTNRWKWPLDAVLGHSCTLLRCEDRASSRVGTQECTQIGQNGPSAPFRGICVHCCDASCVRWHECLDRHGVPAAPPRWPLSLGREDRLCASGAAARLASSPRRQPTRTPEEPHKAP